MNLSGETSAFSLIELDIISILILLGLDIELPLLESPLLYSFYALIAQMVEHCVWDAVVVGSNPTSKTNALIVK